jgi:hypothetical protein
VLHRPVETTTLHARPTKHRPWMHSFAESHARQTWARRQRIGSLILQCQARPTYRRLTLMSGRFAGPDRRGTAVDEWLHDLEALRAEMIRLEGKMFWATREETMLHEHRWVRSATPGLRRGIP